MRKKMMKIVIAAVLLLLLLAAGGCAAASRSGTDISEAEEPEAADIPEEETPEPAEEPEATDIPEAETEKPETADIPEEEIPEPAEEPEAADIPEEETEEPEATDIPETEVNQSGGGVSEEAPLTGFADSEEEARTIAKEYGITLVSYESGVASYYTDEDLSQVLERGAENGYPELYVNYVRNIMN